MTTFSRVLRRVGTTATAAASAAALILTLAPAAPASAEPGAGQKTGQKGSAAGDGIRERQLDRLIEAVHRKGAIGVTGELVTPDGTWTGAAGSNERNPRLPATEDAQFRAASVSKMLTTVLAMQLVENRRWSLDTTIGDVLPDLWPGQEDVTLRQLLSHTSGLPEYLTPLIATAVTTAQFQAAVSQRRTDAELVAAARTQPTTARGRFSYANTNFVVVGMMLEKATGRGLGALMRQRVFAPAEMTESTWATTPRTTRPVLKEYARLYGKVASFASFDPTMFSGAGALLTTARDLDRFQLALSRGELVTRSLVRQMRGVTSDGGATGLQYGLGSYRVPDPCRPGRYLYGHDGGSWATFTLSYSSRSGDRRVAVAMTGRDYDGNTDAVRALNVLAVKALAQTCGGTPVRPSQTPTSGRLVAPPVG